MAFAKRAGDLQHEQDTAEDTWTIDKNEFYLSNDSHLSIHNQQFTVHTTQAYTPQQAQSYPQSHTPEYSHPLQPLHTLVQPHPQDQTPPHDMYIEEALIDLVPPSPSNAVSSSKYIYTQDLLTLASKVPASPISLPPSCCQITTPLKIDQWKVALKDHPDKQLASFIIEGITDGFHIGYDRADNLLRSA